MANGRNQVYNMKMNKQNKLEINLLIYAKNQARLWELRDFFYEIQEKTECKLNLFLTYNLQTVFDMFFHISGGVDLFISDEILSKAYEEALQRKINKFAPMCRRIIRKINGYIYVYNIEEGLRIMEHWGNEEVCFENRVYDLLKRFIYKEARKGNK